jgi:hypothetical protein
MTPGQCVYTQTFAPPPTTPIHPHPSSYTACFTASKDWMRTPADIARNTGSTVHDHHCFTVFAHDRYLSGAFAPGPSVATLTSAASTVIARARCGPANDDKVRFHNDDAYLPTATVEGGNPGHLQCPFTLSSPVQLLDDVALLRSATAHSQLPIFSIVSLMVPLHVPVCPLAHCQSPAVSKRIVTHAPTDFGPRSKT